MDALRSQVGSRNERTATKEPPLLQEVKPASAAPKGPERQASASSASSADEALEILRNEPGYDALVSSLRFLLAEQSSFNIHHPTPLCAQIVQILVTAILPNYWTLLQEDQKEDGPLGKRGRRRGARSDLELFLACLRSVTGLSALAVRLRALIAEANAGTTTKEQSTHTSWELAAVVEVICKLLADESSVSQLWVASVSGTASEAKRRPLSQEYLNIVGSGKIMTLAAEATAIMKQQARALGNETSYWIADGKKYSQWLVRGIIRWDTNEGNTEDNKLRGDLLGKAMRLGYPDTVITTLVSDLLLSDTEKDDGKFGLLLDKLPAHEQKKILSGILSSIPENRNSPNSGDAAAEDASTISAMAGLIKQVVGSSIVMQEQFVAWLVSSPGVGLENGIDIRRAAMAVVADDSKSLIDILEKSLAEFGDQLFIKHTPIMQQEAKAQVLLLAAGYVHRANARALATLLRSRTYLSTISNRLGASQTKARFLGMVVGEALSGLVDEGKKLNFDMEEMRSEEADWYKGLVRIHDTIGSIDLLRSRRRLSEGPSTASQRKPQLQKTVETAAIRRPAPMPRTAGFVIEELDGSDEDEDDLIPYGKPDSDAEDSDDDPTMLRRDKPKAPVYIRDLITYFQDTENYDKQRLALTTAPVLIRRKATFGTEVQQHARELATILVGLHDTYDMDDFHDLRLQGMVAIVVAQPRMVGPWFASAFFEGDYSLAQRASILTALGLAARELAGFDTSEHASAAAFPSKQLPERVERLYSQPVAGSPGLMGGPSSSSSPGLRALQPGALDRIADSLTAGLLGPIAAKAADQATGPDVLKLASFTSRLDTSGQLAKVARAAKTTKKTNTAAPVIATAIFFPLAARFQLALHMAVGSSGAARSTRSVLFEPSVLSLYLKTLAVSLHAVGPGALALPEMTAELWSLLLGSSVQAHCVGDVVVTHAVLFALLAMLDVNEGRMRDICRDMSREVVQTRDWIMQVLESTRSSSDGQENEVQMLAAGTYIRLTEGMESYRSLLLGEMIG